MKPALVLLAGVLLLVGGAYALLEGGYLSTRREVLDVGGVRIVAEQRDAIAPWAAGLALVIGTSLVVVAATKRR